MLPPVNNDDAVLIAGDLSAMTDAADTMERRLVRLIAHYRQRALMAEDALRPFARYAEMRQARPLRGMADNVHSIHTGTDYEATITFSDCIAARVALTKG